MSLINYLLEGQFMSSGVDQFFILLLMLVAAAIAIPIVISRLFYAVRAEKHKSEQITNLNDNNDGVFHHRALYKSKANEIKIDTKERTIYLSDGTREKTYSFDHIKSWRYNIEGLTLTYGVGYVNAALATGLNSRSVDKRKANSGFFIMTTDLKDPEWHIHFFSEHSPKSDKYEKDMHSQLLTWMNVFDHVFNDKIATK